MDYEAKYKELLNELTDMSVRFRKPVSGHVGIDLVREAVNTTLDLLDFHVNRHKDALHIESD